MRIDSLIINSPPFANRIPSSTSPAYNEYEPCKRKKKRTTMSISKNIQDRAKVKAFQTHLPHNCSTFLDTAQKRKRQQTNESLSWADASKCGRYSSHKSHRRHIFHQVYP